MEAEELMVNEIVYITGHKNPDTDSICSAIAYADLKKKSGISAVPIRIGKINRETEFVLEYFGVAVPEYLETVRTQVSDLNMDFIKPVSSDISLKTAWNIMKKNDIRVLPITADDEHLIGIITLSDITRNFMDALENNILSASNTPLKNIIETLNAKLVNGDEKDFRSTGKVVITAMMPDDMEPFIEKGDIVLAGNRKDSQIRALELGASCIILICGSKIDKDTLSLAQKSKCIVIENNNDIFTTARLINQSIPIGFVMTKENIISFNINDYTDSIQEKMLKTRYRSYPVVDEEYKIKGFISRYHLISQKRKKIILLDHNEKSQTIDGIEQAEIVEIIDHHRVGDIQTANPIFFKNEPVGSTASLIANLFFENEIKPSKSIAGILCAAILSDTMKFKSPTSTHMDKIVAVKLAEIAEINIDEFTVALFRAGSSLKGMSPEDIINYDFKDFSINQYKIGIGQINSSDTEIFYEMKDNLSSYMGEVVQQDNYNLILLMVTDINNEGSHVLFAGRDLEIIIRVFNAGANEKSVYLKGVISRKKQIVPMLSNAIQNIML